MIDLGPINEILNEEFDAIIVDLRLKHRELGMSSSGNWENNLFKDIKETGADIITAKIIAPNYTYFLVHGRGPGKQPPADNIERWIKTQNSFNQAVAEIGLSNLAFIIARAIAKKGTKYYQRGGTDLVSSVITPERIEGIITRIKDYIKFAIVGDLRAEYSELASV